jgi:transcriptional regulator with XRE-family HTH domain
MSGKMPRDPVVDVLGTNLRAARKRSGMSAEQVGRRTGQSDQAVHAHERGDRQPNVSHLVRYAEVFGVPAAALLRTSQVCRLCLGVPPPGFLCQECAAEGPPPFPAGGAR